ncbi:MAG TPA: hypothetical protein PLM07_18265 [Candidatus Rifleibacterium sp.]|nr:hypothetical protein [Candidatus Rifleibacterium sp.]HPT47827.1 hypothetical protein [Candidatus Rifleibacterium sp.]
MRRLLIAVIMLSFCSAAFAGLDAKVSLDFRDTDVREILKTLVAKADMGLVLDEAVAGKITLTFKNTPIREAIDLVSIAAGFPWFRKGNHIIVSDFRKIPGLTKVVAMKHISADAAAHVLSQSQIGEVKVVVSSNNRLVLTGDRNGVERAMRIVAGIDKPTRLIKGSLQIMHGGAVLETFNFQTGSNNSISFLTKGKQKTATEGKKAKATASVIDCSIFIAGGVTTSQLSGSIKLKIDLNDKAARQECTHKFSGVFTAPKGKPVLLFATEKRSPLKVVLTWQD